MPSPKRMEKLVGKAARRRDIDRPDDPAPCDPLPDVLADPRAAGRQSEATRCF
jgi:hypothetical protein